MEEKEEAHRQRMEGAAEAHRLAAGLAAVQAGAGEFSTTCVHFLTLVGKSGKRLRDHVFPLRGAMCTSLTLHVA